MQEQIQQNTSSHQQDLKTTQVDNNSLSKQEQFKQNQQSSQQNKQSSQSIHNNNSNVLTISQISNPTEKQQKQSSNDGLNSQRSYPSSLSNYNQKDNPKQGIQNCKNNKQKIKQKNNKKQSTQRQNILQQQDFQDQDNISQDSRLKYDHSSSNNNKASMTFLKLFFMICKKQYAFEIIRILLYAFISITIFAYSLDQNKQKKQFYEAFYSSQQITISKQINGVFPPLFGQQNDILNRTWILETYNNHLLVDNEEQNYQPTRQELLFQFTPYNVLYIKTNTETCIQQLKFKWKTFDYNMRIYQVLESDFQKIQDQSTTSCFPNKKDIQQKMRQVSLWTIDWQSKQLYLLSQPFREQNATTIQRWNELIVLKKQSVNI